MKRPRRPTLKELVSLPKFDAKISEKSDTAPINSLSGALLRLQFIRESILNDPKTAAHAYQLGIADIDKLKAVNSARNQAVGPDVILQLANKILEEKFAGNLSDALNLVADYCRIQASGLTSVVAESEIGTSRTLERAVTLTAFANDLDVCADLAKTGELL